MLIDEIQAKVSESSASLRVIREEIAKAVIGQDKIISRLLIAILADGHVLIEGVPGLAKTLIVSSLAHSLQARFARIQFTPDLLPADITGTLIYNQKTGEFTPKRGLSLQTLSSQTRSIVRRQRCNLPSWKQCRSGR